MSDGLSAGDSAAAGLLAAALGARTPSGVQRVWEPPALVDLQCALPQYDILALAGRGAMGAVFKGWQRSLDRAVAIKVLPAAIAEGDAGFAERFQREARAMARLSHPGIVAVHDAGTTPEGLHYFVMDFIEGGDVQRMLAAQGRLTPADALAIAASVLDALACAHEHGVIHRDIKPSNVMVDAEGRVKVADFGLARLPAAEASLLTGSDVAMGTPDFMAPEARDGAHAVDHRADLYAVGVMLYQMLTGHLPRGRFAPPSQAVAGLDPRLDAIVDRVLMPAPEARFASAAEMRAALEGCRAGAGARPEAPAAAASRARRIPLLAGGAALAVAALAIGGWSLWDREGKKRPHSSVAPVAEVRARPTYPQPPEWNDQTSVIRERGLKEGKLVADAEWMEGISAIPGVFRFGGEAPLADVILRVSYANRIGLRVRRDDRGSGYSANIEGRKARISFMILGKVGSAPLCAVDLGAAYHPEGVHEAVFCAQGSQLRLWIDGQLVATATDDRQAAGKLEVLAAAGGVFPPARFRRIEFGVFGRSSDAP